MHVNAWKAAVPATPVGSPRSRERHHRSSSSKCHKPRRTCALVAVQADELHGALMRGPAALTLSDVLPPRAVPECEAIASEGHLQGSTEHPPECRAVPSAAPQPLLEHCPAKDRDLEAVLSHVTIPPPVPFPGGMAPAPYLCEVCWVQIDVLSSDVPMHILILMNVLQAV